MLFLFLKKTSLGRKKINDDFLHLVFNPPYGERLSV